MIKIEDKIEYARLMGEGLDLETMRGWNEDDFYAVYLNFTYKGLPSGVLNATFRVLMANLNLNGHGFTESEERIFLYGYGEDTVDFQIKVTNQKNMLTQGKRYFMAFAKEVLSSSLKGNFALYEDIRGKDEGRTLSKVRVESKKVLEYISDKEGFSKNGLEFNSADKSDIIGYIGGEILTFPNRKDSVVQEYVTIWGMAIGEYISIPTTM